MSEGERRLAAIMYTDIVGYTSLTQKDESSTLQALEKHRSLLRPLFTSHEGREIKTTGDGFIIEFQSALDAVLCAVAIQQMMHDRKLSTGETISLRIGIHVGDVVERGGDILGDAVNIASRIEPLAEPGGVCISSQVYEQVRNKSDLPFVSLGDRSLKNVSTPVGVYRARMPWEQSAVEAPTYATNRIAILPFASFSPDPNDAYFADGITDEIISATAGISGLKVISRTSVVGYKGTTKRIEEIGRELKVGSILEGTFKKAGNRIRVTTQLIKVADDEHLWAQNYDRNLDDIFEVQSDVAKQVAEALRVRIINSEKERVEKKPTESLAAYTLYLRGRQLWNKRTLDDVREALTYFERAVKEDSDFALGYVGQADCYLVAPWIPTINESLEKAKPLVSKALELDPDLAEARTTNGLVLACEYDLRHAEEEFKKAIELKPSYETAHQWFAGRVLEPELRWDEALEHLEKAVELDPLSPRIIRDHAFYYLYRKNFGKALELFKRFAELMPSYPDGHGGLMHIYGEMKMYGEMEKEAEAFGRLAQVSFPRIRTRIATTTAAYRGDKETVKRTLPEWEAHPKEAGLSAYSVADFYFFLGELDKGFERLERAYSERDSGLLGIQFDSDLDNVRTDPRYLDLLKRLGLDQTPQTK